MIAQIISGDCLEKLKTIDAESIDSLVTDPPAGISFMGKSWDSDKGGRNEWVTWMSGVMKECLRVLKPGAHGLIWALPRTSHWTATALEDAGFEVRDVVTHLFGQGFPKSLDISKAIDKANGDKRPIVGPSPRHGGGIKGNGSSFELPPEKHMITSAASAAWQGWGTALKPASEHWILVRKPLGEKTVAANVLKHGTGGINIDGCRIGTDVITTSGDLKAMDRRKHVQGDRPNDYKTESAPSSHTGRFPANCKISPHRAHLISNVRIHAIS